MAIAVEDRELVVAHQQGDGDAFDKIVREYQPKLMATARGLLRCEAAAQDAVQQTFSNAYRHLDTFNGEYRLGAWLSRILTNVCYDETSRRRRDHEKSERFGYARVSPDFQASPEEELELDVDHSALHDAFRNLQPSYAEALHMRAVEGLEYDEIAERVGVSEENVRARVSRAKRAMRSALAALAVLPVVGVVIPLLSKFAAGAALAIAVLVPAGDSLQPTIADVDNSGSLTTVFPEPAPSPSVDTAPPALENTRDGTQTVPAPAEPVDATARTTDRADGAVGTGGAQTSGQTSSQLITVAKPEQATTPSTRAELSDATSQRAGATTSAPALDEPLAESTAEPLAEPTAVPTAEDSASSAPAPTAASVSAAAPSDPLSDGVPTLKSGESFGVSAQTLGVTASGPNRVAVFGNAWLSARTTTGSVTVNDASRLAVGDAAAQLTANGATAHPVDASFAVTLSDGTLLELQLRGTATHFGHASRATGGITMDVTGVFRSQVRVPLTADIRPSQVAPLTGTGSFAGTLSVDRRSGAASLTAQFTAS